MPDRKDESVRIEASIEQKRLDVAQLSNHLIAQFDGEFLFLNFCQIQPPLMDLEQAKAAGSVTVVANPVAAVAIPAAKLRAFVDVLQKQLQHAEDAGSVPGIATTVTMDQKP